ncbi:sulfotransferase 1A1-like [Diadema antillarum]|uniref:sulfotransferase 1A1-like n=1 Tax=Diadema antillarum TaxID=105358 RepID=UPI003A83CD53
MADERKWTNGTAGEKKLTNGTMKEKTLTNGTMEEKTLTNGTMKEKTLTNGTTPAPRQNTYKGIVFPPLMKPEIIEGVQSMKFHPDDIIIVTSPKSGTHWMVETVGLLLADGVWENVRRASMKHHLEGGMCNKDTLKSSSPIRPFYRELEKMDSPRVMTSHLPLHLLPPGIFEAKAKIIYLARNPKDVMTSFFKFVALTPQGEFYTWDKILNNIFTDKNSYGAWDKHVLSYWKVKHLENIMFLKFEDMKTKQRACVASIAKFINHPVSEDILDDVISKTSIDGIRKEMARLEETLEDGNQYGKAYGTVSYYRKGIIGDWKNCFTVAQSEQFDRELQERLHGSGLTFEFE